MNVLLEELMNLLMEDIRLNGSMLSILHKEREALVGFSLEQIERAGIEKESLLSRLSRQEQSRKELLCRISDSMSGFPGKTNFQDLIAIIPEPYLTRLTKLREKLLILTEKLRQANEHNRKLFSHTLDLVRGALSAMNNILCPERIYYNDGRIQNTIGTGRMISGEI